MGHENPQGQMGEQNLTKQWQTEQLQWMLEKPRPGILRWWDGEQELLKECPQTWD